MRLSDLLAEAELDPLNPERQRASLGQGNRTAAAFFEGDRPTVLYFGKLL